MVSAGVETHWLTQDECKALRLLSLWRYLEAGGSGTAAELATRYRVSERTINRDIVVLTSLLPITEMRDGARARYSLMRWVR